MKAKMFPFGLLIKRSYNFKNITYNFINLNKISLNGYFNKFINSSKYLINPISSYHNPLILSPLSSQFNLDSSEFNKFSVVISNIYNKLSVAFKQLSILPRNVKSLNEKILFFQNTSDKKNTNSYDKRNEEEKNENDPENGNKISNFARFMLFTWILFGLYMFISLTSPDEVLKVISWNEFYYDMLAKGEVDHVIIRPEIDTVYVRLHKGAVIKGQQMKRDGLFALKVDEVDRFEAKLRRAENELGIVSNNNTPIIYQHNSSWIPKLIGLALVLGLIYFIKKSFKFQFPNPADMFANERKANFLRVDLMTKEGKGITFKDVAGLHEAKVEIMEFVDYLKTPETYKLLGAKIPKGALLLGPPGCGKTLLAKAVATEAKVPFLAMAGSEFVEMLGGLGAARVRDLFKEARQRSPCIIYIDEIDAIGKKRSGDMSQNTEEEHTLNQLLVEMDGIGTTAGVIVLASTNREDVLDKALLRAGRLDRHILIDFPILAERKEIFEIYLKKLKLKMPASEYSEALSQMSPGMSGADIANICNEAALHAARILMKNVDMNDFEYAVERVTVGVAKKSRILSEIEKKTVAYHEAGHALIGWILKTTNQLMKVSIIPRTSHALGYAQYFPQDNKLHTNEALFEEMCLILGGRVAESLTFNCVTSGAEDDLKKVTKLAYNQVRTWGMNEKVGLVSFPILSNENSAAQFQPKPYSKLMASIIDKESSNLIAKAYKHTEKLLIENKEKLKVIAEALLKKESLSYKDMEELIGPPPFGPKRFLSTPSKPPTTPDEEHPITVQFNPV